MGVGVTALSSTDLYMAGGRGKVSKVNNEIQSAKRNYYKTNLAQNDRNLHKMWKTINEILGNFLGGRGKVNYP